MGMDPFRWGPMAGPYLAPQSLGFPFAPQQLWWDVGRNPMANGLQAMQAPLWPMAAGQGQMPGLMSPFASGPAAAEQNFEVQAMTGFLQDVSSGAIRKLFDYFSSNSERFPQLANGVTLLNQAVESFKVRDYARAFGQIYDVYRYITAVRATAPELPAMA